MQQRNFFKSLWDECRKISEPTIGDSDKLKWVTNWCQFLFQETRKWSAVSHYWKHSKSFNWRNIWKWLWAPSRHSLPVYFLLHCHVLCLWFCDRSWTLTVKSGNKITVSCNFSSNLQMQRIPTILLPVIVLCKVVLCQIRFTSYNFVLSFKACVVHHITFLSDSQLHSWTYSAIYWHPQTFSSQDAAAWLIMKEVICRKIIRDNNGR